MSDFLRAAGSKLLLGVGGLVLALAWLAWPGSDEPRSEAHARLPEVVYGGGGGRLAIRCEVNQPATLTASFAQATAESDVHVEEALSPGSYERVVDLARDTYVYLEVGVPQAKLGAAIDWSVALNGKTVTRETIRLDRPLEGNHAFFVQFEAEDLAQIEEWLGERRAEL